MRSPQHSLNKAYRRQKINRSDIELFQQNLQTLLKELDEKESEEHVKNDVITFLNDTWYKGEYAINTKDRTDLVIHNEKTTKSTAGVLMEVKKPSNKAEMITTKKLNNKALRELVLYYLRERIENENRDIKHFIVTNVYEWFIFDGTVFYNCFYKNHKLVKAFKEWQRGQMDSSYTTMFFKDIAAPAIEEALDQLEFTHFDLREYQKDFKSEKEVAQLIPVYKLLSPVHLLKQPFANDSNSLNKQFYHELLHIIGLEEVKEKGKKVIQRKVGGKRDEGSLLENAISIMDERDRLRGLDRSSHFGATEKEQLYNVALELCITWINRILFLKLLESQLVSYHKGDTTFRFLDAKTIPNYDALESLFFGVLARKQEDRKERLQEKFAHVPYLNSSLFEPTGLEKVLTITMLNNNLELNLHSLTVLKNEKGKRVSGKKDTLNYLFEFLDAYDFTSEGTEEIQEENKSLINASVLGLIFEKINGYKDGSFYTPGFITMYMCKETIRRAVVQKFNEVKGWECKNLDDLYDKIEDRKEANAIVNSLKICDPAVGSGHFLVSALNEMIAIKNDLKIFQDRDGKRLKEYVLEVVNDELVITDDDGELFEYSINNKESQRLQETLFHEKQTIIENCLFGVDINPNSVKICRLRLWIELLKNSYYKNETELETLPNIDINIKTGNSLISRFDLDSDMSKVLKSVKYSIDEYRSFVNDYKNATDKEEKRGFETLINQIKKDFRTEIGKNDPKVIRKNRLGGELYNLLNQVQAFELTEKAQKEQNKKRDKFEKAINKLSAEIEGIKSSKIYEDAFEWRFEFPEVLDDAGNFVGFDVVIGNPPYIRQEELSHIKPYLEGLFQTFTGTADLYVYFVEQGMKLLREEGHFTFIIPNKWMRAGYGKKLRQFVKRHAIDRILDFGDLPVFEEATTYPLILVAQNQTPNDTFVTIKVESLEEKADFNAYVSARKNVIQHNSLTKDTWIIGNSSEQELLKKVKSVGQLLGDYVDGKIYYGIKTGFNEAFVIDKKTRDQLVSEDPKSEGIIKPSLAGRDIRRYESPKSDKYLIFTRRGTDITKYSSVLKHLKRFKTQLKPKPEDFKGEWKGRTPGSYKWYEIQAAVDYYSLFAKPKIMYQTFQVKPCFILDTEGLFCNNSMWIIPTADKVLLAILNSKMGWWLISKYCTAIQNGYQLIWKYFSQISIAKASLEQSRFIEGKVNKIISIKKENPSAVTVMLEAEIDQLVYQLYGLTDKEIAIVEEGSLDSS